LGADKLDGGSDDVARRLICEKIAHDLRKTRRYIKH
jgi:hypothetical protein